MRAITVDEFKGAPRLADIAQPLPKQGQLLVKVVATAINPFDWKVADGILDGKVPTIFPLVLGQDAAGTVSAIGSGVTRFKPGDKVFGQFFHPPVGEGTFADYALVPESGAITLLPPEIPFEMAAALPTAGMTALALVETLGLKAGAKVLIVGASGGVGSFATQLAAGQSLHVIATASAADADRLKKLGAKEILTSRNAALVKDVKNDHPQGIDGIIDLASDASNLAVLAGLVRDDGCVLTTVFSADEKALRARHLRGGNFEVKATSALLTRLADTVKSGKLSVPIESTISLEQAPEAIARSRGGHSRGKTVIRI